MGPSRVPRVTITSYSILMDVGPICQSKRQMKETQHDGRGEKESENDILEKNGVHYRVTGFQETIKGFRHI